MKRWKMLLLGGAVLAASLLRPGAASAGWLFHCDDCPPPSYSPLRYWAPEAARASDCVHGPKLSVCPPDRHPDVPPTYHIYKYPCPAVDAAVLVNEYPFLR